MYSEGKYSPVQIRNPISKNHLVRLLPGQKIKLIFTRPEFKNASATISGDFLTVEDIEPLKDGWSATISQKMDFRNLGAVGLFLGEIHVSGDLASSLCVVANTANDYLRVIQPSNNCCCVEPAQLFDVFFYSSIRGEDWDAWVKPGKFRMERIDHQVNPISENYVCFLPNRVEEHYFRFRFDASSIELIQELSHGKYDAGTLNFHKAGLIPEKATLKILLNWKSQKNAHKALLLPRNLMRQSKSFPKQAMQTKVLLHKMELDDMESGCNVVRM